MNGSVVNRLLDGFDGKLTVKYEKLAKCSHDRALRDIAARVERGILLRNPEGGRSTNSSLAKGREVAASYIVQPALPVLFVLSFCGSRTSY